MITTAAAAVAMKAYRSVTTCWKEPSTLRLWRLAPAKTRAAARLTTTPASATTSTGTASTSGGDTSRLTASYTITPASTSRVIPLTCADRISARPSP
jgi:hypothetical protein